MADAGYGQERAVGRVVFVSNYRVNILLDPDTRSQVRSFPRNITVITQIGGYLVFPVSPGVLAVGIIVGASEDEAFEPDAHGLTLQLARARRILRLNLLGQLRLGEPFVAGISNYPTLDTPALLPSEWELTEILQFRPRSGDGVSDSQLTMGLSPVYGQQPVMASYNDLLSRPLGVVGNTGSGKSCSVARLIQEALTGTDDGNPVSAKFIILDINGEYSNAFGTGSPHQKELNSVYVNGQPFVLPLWAFNLTEFCAFFEASQASQLPVLERVVSELRENSIDKTGNSRTLRLAVRIIDSCHSFLDSIFVHLDAPSESFCGDKVKQLRDHLKVAINRLLQFSWSDDHLYPKETIRKLSFDDIDLPLSSLPVHNIPVSTADLVRPRFEAMRFELNSLRGDAMTSGALREVTADSPVPFASEHLLLDEFFHSATARFRGQDRMQEYLATLRLRIHRQLADKRWSVFTTKHGGDLAELVESALGGDHRVAVVDCSMLAHDVLPSFCAVFGRILLDLRSRTDANNRTHQPFIVVLEEAHNYLRPHRQEEPWGIRLSRDAFERISKEGRKFGLSLIIASQRPSDVSATVLSQCANFLIHRIQNPEDIDYFKKILPLGSRDLLEQLPILAPGEGLLMGSAVNVPTRIKVRKPDPAPESETSQPWKAWQEGQPKFDRANALDRWTKEATPAPATPQATQPEPQPESVPYEDVEDDIPF